MELHFKIRGSTVSKNLLVRLYKHIQRSPQREVADEGLLGRRPSEVYMYCVDVEDEHVTIMIDENPGLHTMLLEDCEWDYVELRPKHLRSVIERLENSE